MELRHLRYFVAVAEQLSFTAAAARLSVSQPPLSQQIRDLEAELRTDLFVRSSRRVALTEAGTAFLEQARAILAQVRQAADEARAIGSGRTGRLTIGLTGSILTGPLGHLIRCFREDHPDVDIRLHEMPPEAQQAALHARRTDLSFLRSPPDDPDLRAELAWRERVGVALPEAHPLADRASLPLIALRDARYLSLRLADSRFANTLWDACLASGFVPRLSHQMVESHALLGLVAAGLGLALVPEFVGRLPYPGIAYRPLDEPAPNADVYALARADPGPIATNFLAAMRTQLSG
ncbi:LysR substrate-binding domain-containing protein [Methylobacterium soli]|uniref:LysR family transcriptional regulator n=1 Tax=Methylobacterium soli TaxID=553447 RepID=A0A6L3T2H5_9HYPH|nr:LysR substrate-binding domain-containing protein [Methylobacterium soli]KAB1080721.1 LysR family transcriptional regulator [Methylobacterium soli]GJE46610.1 HTH-type transcriptional regulator BenM [Methylobacterium soli]